VQPLAGRRAGSRSVKGFNLFQAFVKSRRQHNPPPSYGRPRPLNNKSLSLPGPWRYYVCCTTGIPHEGVLMRPVEAFFLGLMAAWTPSLIVLAWILWRDAGSEKQSGGRHH